MAADNKLLIAQWFEEVWNQKRTATIDELMSPDCLTKVEGLDEPLSREAFKEYQRAFLSAVPDLIAEVPLLTGEGDTVVASWRARGTHLGAGLGVPPSGRPVDFTGLSVFELAEGRIVRGFDRWNRGEMIASLMQVRINELGLHRGLTRREAQVALLMAERYSHTEIAEQLGIRPNTARRHSERVLNKLGIHRRQDVAEALGKVPVSVLARHGSDITETGQGRS